MIKWTGVNPSQLVNCILQKVRSGLGDIETVAASTAVGLMTYRIHNQGLATDGNSIGRYKPVTVQYRKSKGLQTAYVDLEDTGRLFRSQQVVRQGNETFAAIVGIRSDNRQSNADLSYSLENRFGTTIFEPTDDEFKKINAVVDAELAKLIQSCFP